MAIGTTAAIIGSAVIGAGASAIAGSKNSKAIRQSSDAQAQSNREAIAAQERARTENLALQRPIYNAGMPAISARNALLGLGGTQASANNNATQPSGQPSAQGGRMNAAAMYGLADGMSGYNPAAARDMSPITSSSGYNWGNGRAPNAYWQQQMNQGAVTQPTQGTAGPTNSNGGTTAQDAQENAFDAFRNSTGYQFRLNEGYDALNSGYAGAGVLQSGAAMNAAQEYGQNMASAEFGNYWNMLGEQQNLASGAANAMSGVNTTYANNAGNLAIANGQNQASAAIARANNTNAMIGGIGGAFGNALGAFAYRPGA